MSRRSRTSDCAPSRSRDWGRQAEGEGRGGEGAEEVKERESGRRSMGQEEAGAGMRVQLL